MNPSTWRRYLSLVLIAMLVIPSLSFHSMKSGRINLMENNKSLIKYNGAKLLEILSEKAELIKQQPYSIRFHRMEFSGYGTFTDYPLRTTIVGDFFRLDYRGEFEIAIAKTYELHGVGVKIVLYTAGISSPSEREDFIYHWNLSIKDIAPMDLNGTYYIDPPYSIGYEGRSAWREFYIKFLKLLFDAGFDGIEIDGGDGYFRIGSFDPETVQRFKEYLASKYNSTELEEKFNITDINTFNFTQYLRDLGYHHYSLCINHVTIAHPGIEGPKGNKYAEALWREFIEFNLRTLIDFYKTIWENVKKWEEESGRDFYISTKTTFNDLILIPYVDAVHWEYTWPNYPNRTASMRFKIYQNLNKTFNLWIAPWSSLESTGFPEWYTFGWNKTSDPEEQYLALAEIVMCGGRIPISEGTNKTHFKQFIRLFQENPQLFWQTPYGDIALVYSFATNFYFTNITSGYENFCYDSYEGTYYLLADSHRSVDVIVFGDDYWLNITPSLAQLSKYKAIVLPETICLTDDQASLLEQYVENGGIIIGIGEIGTRNGLGEPVNRTFSNYFDGGVHRVGNGLIVSITNISPSQYLKLRMLHDPSVDDILNAFKSILDQYVPPEIWSERLSPRAHIYRFFNYEENALIFGIINFNYSFAEDKVIRDYNVDFSFKLPPQLKDQKLSIWIYNEKHPEGFEVSYNINGDTVTITIPELTILTVIEVRPYFEYHEPMIIDKFTVYDGETIILDRDLLVKSVLVLSDSEIVVRGSVKPIKIEVLPGGALYIMNSKVRKESGYYYIVARKGSKIFISNSEISGAGLFGPLDRGGLCIETRDAVILNSIIHDNYEFGILLFNADHSIIGNNLIFNNNIGVAIINSSYIDVFNNTVINNNVGVCVESPDIYDAGVRLRELIRMWERRRLPSRGAVKITISNCRISMNTYDNIIVIGCNFVTIKNSEISNSKGNNIFFWETSTLKVYNCTIHSARYGIYLEECPVNTILNNRIYNHSFAGILIYKCVYQGVLYWNHLENPAGDTRIIGNYIRNNTYGIYMDFGWGYSNADMRIQKNEISYNDVGIYVNLTQGIIYENNFIKNKKHAIVGPGGGQGWWGSGLFYLNISQILYDFHDPPVGNYWDDWDKKTMPYEVCPRYYDYYPLDKPVEIPKILDDEGPYIKTENYRVIWINATHFKIKFDYLVTDQSALGGALFKDTLRYFGCYHFLGPYLRQLDPPYYELEFPWLGYPAPPTGELPNPETLNNTFRESFESSVINATWLEGAILTLYVTDMWGNWNKNDTAPPHVAIISEEPIRKLGGRPFTIYVLVSDWSPISKVQLMCLNGSSWITIDMVYDESTHLYYASIPSQLEGTIIRYKIYAEDIYGNSFLSEEQHLDLEGPIITDISHNPQKPTSNDIVKITANITDPSGVDIVILSYSTDQSTWYNISMSYNATSGLYEATIPAMPSDTTVYYKIYASDIYRNWAESEVYSYTVSTPAKPWIGNYLLGVLISIVVIVTVIFIVKKRKILH